MIVIKSAKRFSAGVNERQRKSRNEINRLANFCFLTRSDNNLISDKSPKDYGVLIDSTNKDEYLENAVSYTHLTLPTTPYV